TADAVGAPHEVTDRWTFARPVGAGDPNWTLVATSGAVCRWCSGLRDLRPGYRVELRARLGFVRKTVRSHARFRFRPAVRR
ncbi:MAG: hypothetical protein ACTS5I_16575, partial [Rhodanobacter sp.]